MKHPIFPLELVKSKPRQHCLYLIGAALVFTFLPCVEVNGDMLAVGLNFLGNQQTGVPPDTMGAVGKDHIVELNNTGYFVYNKSDGSTAQDSSTLTEFWSGTGADFDEQHTIDPRILYDPFAERWFATAIDNSTGEEGKKPNNILIAVSNSSDPLMGWTGFAMDSDPENIRWADFPTLGFDEEGVYVSPKMVAIDPPGDNTAVFIFPKDDLLKSTPTISNASALNNLGILSVGIILQPVVDLDNFSSLNRPSLISSFDSVSGRFVNSEILGPIDQPVIDSACCPDTYVTPYNAHQGGAEQPGPKKNLESGDDRLTSNVVYQKGSIWGVHTVDHNNRSALRWFEIDGNGKYLLQEGLIADDELDFYYGSIAVNKFNDVVIGFNGSSENQFPSSYAVLGQTWLGITYFGYPALLKASSYDYENLIENRNRWGDYSATVLDPIDPKVFWTFQERTIGPDTAGIQITRLFLFEVPLLIDTLFSVNNGSFEEDGGWFTTGMVSTIPPEDFGGDPTHGNFHALLDTDNGAIPSGDIETFLGLPPRALDSLAFPSLQLPTEGFAMKTTFSAARGDVLSFDLNFLTTETLEAESSNDFSFVILAIDGVITNLLKLRDTHSHLVVAETIADFDFQTGYDTLSLSLLETGTYSLGFGVLEVGGSELPSGLLVDNVRITRARPSAIPTLSEWWFIALVLTVAFVGFTQVRRMNFVNTA